MRVVSLFSGCGGLDLGFHSEGFEVVYACDSDSAAVECFNHNFGDVAFKRDVESEEFQNDLERLTNIDVVLGGFPCQGFSKSGPKRKDDSRNTLYLSMVDAVRQLNPGVFVAENVDGMAQNYKGEFLSLISNDFTKLGYTVEHKILNAAAYGVPQYRRRIFFVGFRNDLNLESFKWPEETHICSNRNGEFKISHSSLNIPNLFEPNLKVLSDSVTIKDKIYDLMNKTSVPDHTYIEPSEKEKDIMPRIGQGQKLCNVRFSDTSVYTWNIPKVFGEVTEREILILETIGKNRRKKKYGNIPNGNPLDIDIISNLADIQIEESELLTLVEKGYLKKIEEKFDLKGAMFCSGLYKRPSWDSPSPTIITVFHSPRYFIHCEADRPFTIRECARLQSFPDNFEFLNSGISKKDAYRLIGNAVPPQLGSKIAGQVMSSIKHIYQNEVKAS